MYVPETAVAQQLLDGRLQVVLGSYAPTVPGFFLYYPSRAQRSAALRLFVEAARARGSSVDRERGTESA